MNRMALAIKIVVICAVLGYLIFSYPEFSPIPETTAWILQQMLQLLSINAAADGVYLVVPFPGVGRALHISPECSGVILASLFLLIIFIIPDYSIRHRLIAIPFMAIVFFGNILRILSGILLAFYWGTDFLLFYHNSFGQVLIFLVTVGAYILWLFLTGNFPTDFRERKRHQLNSSSQNQSS